MTIPMADLKAQYLSIKDEIDAAVQRVIENSQFILGPEVDAFEKEMAAYCGTAHAVGVASGTEALQLALLACGIGPRAEVIAWRRQLQAQVFQCLAGLKKTGFHLRGFEDISIRIVGFFRELSILYNTDYQTGLYPKIYSTPGSENHPGYECKRSRKLANSRFIFQ
jgi:hypothetical protein